MPSLHITNAAHLPDETARTLAECKGWVADYRDLPTGFVDYSRIIVGQRVTVLIQPASGNWGAHGPATMSATLCAAVADVLPRLIADAREKEMMTDG